MEEHSIPFPNNLDAFLDLLEKRDECTDDVVKKVNHYLEMKARIRGIPIHGTFELTPLCNLDCKMCYAHLSQEQIVDCRVIEKEQWIDLLHQAVEEGLLMATLTGGECLTYPGFDDIFLYLQSRGVRITVLTNGVLLNEQRIRFFKEHPVSAIQVSLYGTNENVYERVTGQRAFKQVWKNICLAKEAGLPVKIAITPNRYMEEDDEVLIKLLTDAKIPFSVNNRLYKARQETGREIKDYDQSSFDYIRLRKAYMNQRNISLPEPCNETVDTQIPVEGIGCGAGNSGYTIDWQGKMYACVMLRDIMTDPITSSFKTAWETLHAMAQKYPNPIECRTCKYKRLCTKCVAAHRDGAEPGHANLQICHLAKMITEFGEDKR